MDPSTALSMTIYMAKLGVKMIEAPNEIRLVCRMIDRVFRTFQEFVRLSQLTEIRSYWAELPHQKTFVHASIEDAVQTLQDVGECMRSARENQAVFGKVKAVDRLTWAVMKKDEAMLYLRKLEMDHAAVMQHVEKLHKVEADAPSKRLALEKRSRSCDDLPMRDAVQERPKAIEHRIQESRGANDNIGELHERRAELWDDFSFLRSLVSKMYEDESVVPKPKRVISDPSLLSHRLELDLGPLFDGQLQWQVTGTFTVVDDGDIRTDPFENADFSAMEDRQRRARLLFGAR